MLWWFDILKRNKQIIMRRGPRDLGRPTPIQTRALLSGLLSVVFRACQRRRKTGSTCSVCSCLKQWVAVRLLTPSFSRCLACVLRRVACVPRGRPWEASDCRGCLPARLTGPGCSSPSCTASLSFLSAHSFIHPYFFPSLQRARPSDHSCEHHCSRSCSNFYPSGETR